MPVLFFYTFACFAFSPFCCTANVSFIHRIVFVLSTFLLPFLCSTFLFYSTILSYFSFFLPPFFYPSSILPPFPFLPSLLIFLFVHSFFLTSLLFVLPLFFVLHSFHPFFCSSFLAPIIVLSSFIPPCSTFLPPFDPLYF